MAQPYKGKRKEDTDKGTERTQSNQKRHKSFSKYGPKPKPGLYTGHVDRLKNRLIHKAKVKSAYGKMLRQEAAKTHDEQRDRVRGEDDEEVESTEDPDPQALYSDPRNTPEASTSHQPYVHPSRRSDVDASETVAQRTAKRPGESRKTQKSVLRRAEIQNHTKSIAVEKPKRRPKLSQEELEDLRAQRRMQNELYNRKTYKGQPNMNAKMQVLLSKIEKSVQR